MHPDRDDENPIGPDLTALERRLSACRPSAGALDRDRMLYDAGRAAAEGYGRPWQLATGALLLVSLGLGGVLIHQQSSLASDRGLLANERAHRLRLETALAGQTGAVQPASTLPSPAPPRAIEAPGPSSYLALTARLADRWDVGGPVNGGSPPVPQRPTADSSEGEWHPAPLRPQDIQRVLDL
jgi:hypothetical protein